MSVSPEPYRQAGQLYRPMPAAVDVDVDVDAMERGYALRLRFSAVLQGPCARCLEDATLNIGVDAREVHDDGAREPELRSDFVVGDQLDVQAWAEDAIGVEFPHRVLCREDCAGLCPACGTNRNTSTCDCVIELGDGRWDKLREVQFDDRDSGN